MSLSPLYKKSFTRDFALCILQIWSRSEGNSKKVWTDESFPFHPFIVFEKTDLGAASYMDERGIEWIKRKLLTRAHSDSGFIAEIEQAFGSSYDSIQKMFSKEFLDREALSDFLEKLEEYWTWFEAGWWLWETQPEEREGLELPASLYALRERTQNLVPASDLLIRKSLARIFPDHYAYVDLITLEEIFSNNDIQQTSLQERKEHYFVAEGKVITHTSKTQIESKYKIQLEQLDIPAVAECRGVKAFPGIAKGPAKVISNTNNMVKVQTGDILIAPMTLPDVLPAMHKAAAFVTDEGGVMCHAAIMARELKKPCVIGTRIATQVFKDGDMVEVDAEKGIVRKI